ncbi:MAG: DUF4031 domain-containing protein [Marmoricola sp.]
MRSGVSSAPASGRRAASETAFTRDPGSEKHGSWANPKRASGRIGGSSSRGAHPYDEPPPGKGAFSVGIWIDPPDTAAHGRVWSHLISDSSTDELHSFAAGVGIPRRGFDGDHYDVPGQWYDAMIEAGAQPAKCRRSGPQTAPRRFEIAKTQRRARHRSCAPCGVRRPRRRRCRPHRL